MSISWPKRQLNGFNTSYDCFIHHFKNLVLRGPEKYLTRTQDKILAAVRDIDSLASLDWLTLQNRKDLITLQQTLLKYGEHAIMASELWRNNTPINRIDNLVKINDTPASQAIKRLQTSVYTPALERMLASTNSHLQQLNQVFIQNYARLIEELGAQILARKQGVWIYMTILGSSVLILLALITVMTRRILSRDLHIQSVLHYMEDNEDLNIRADEKGDDELGDIAKALNRAIQHRKNIEASLIAEKKKANQASHAKTSFLASMSHQMKTPLNAIIGYSNRLLSKQQDTSSREFEALSTIHSNGLALLKRIDHVLKLVEVESQAENAHYLQALTPLSDLKTIIEKQLDKLAQWPVDVCWQADDCPAGLVGGGACYPSIIEHLLTPENYPETQSDTTTVNIRVFIEDNYCLIDVSYDGANNSQTFLESVFTTSAGLINPASQQHEGSNLNFAILNGIIQQLQGKAGALVSNGRTHYKLYLPLKQE